MNRSAYPKVIASSMPLHQATGLDYASQIPNQSRSGVYMSDLTPVMENGHTSDLIRNAQQSASYIAQSSQPLASPRLPVSSPLSTSTSTPSPVKSAAVSRRSSSSQSIQNISEPNSDDSDDDTGYVAKKGTGTKERRREAHTQAEQKRRDAIKKGYMELEEVLPTFQDSVGSQKPSKAVVLQRSIEYVSFLEEQKKKQADELEALQKDFMGLQIMKQAYEKMALAMRNQPDHGASPISDEVKFRVFQAIMDNLFHSFDDRMVTSCFAELSGSAFNWLEECCTPQHIRSITLTVLNNLKNSHVGKK